MKIEKNVEKGIVAHICNNCLESVRKSWKTTIRIAEAFGHTKSWTRDGTTQIVCHVTWLLSCAFPLNKMFCAEWYYLTTTYKAVPSHIFQTAEVWISDTITKDRLQIFDKFLKKLNSHPIQPMLATTQFRICCLTVYSLTRNVKMQIHKNCNFICCSVCVCGTWSVTLATEHRPSRWLSAGMLRRVV
jgi:hypothetical protein